MFLFFNYSIMKILNIVTMILLLVGGLNWWLVWAIEFDLVATIFWDWSILSKIVYLLVWISAFYTLALNNKVIKWN